MGYLVCILIVSLIVLQLGKKSVMLKRTEWRTAELLQAFTNDDLEACENALHRLSQMYALRIGYFRPDDKFHKDGFLWKWDSWHLWKGQEELEAFLQQYGVRSIPDSWTIQDFVAWFGTVINKKGINGDRGLLRKRSPVKRPC